jgi:Leucine-rich repeat (LRR) protein
MAPTDPVIPEPRRFSLRLPRPLCIGVAAMAMLVASFGLRFGLSIYRRLSAMRDLESAGATVDTYPLRSKWLRDPVVREIIRPLEPVHRINLVVLNAGDNDLVPLRDLPDTEVLTIYGDNITDAGFGNLEGLRSLKVLNAGVLRITDVCLRHIAGLKSLEELDISFARVTDEGINHLVGLPRLQRLDISRTQITDVALERIKQMPALEFVDLSTTNVSDDGVAELQRVMPGLTINR